MKTWLVLSVMFAALVAAAIVAIVIWTSMGDTEISLSGMIALALGAGLSLVLGVGLMLLVFYSSRKGYDDQDR